MKIIYNELAELADIGHYNFAQKVKLVLSCYGFDINQYKGLHTEKLKSLG